MRLKRFDLRFLFILCLALPIALLTQFENKVSIELARSQDGTAKIVVKTHTNRFEATLPFGQLEEIQAAFQHSMAGQTSLAALDVNHDSQLLKLIDSHGVYLFGRAWGSGFISADTSSFKSSFGDWTIDRFMSASTSIGHVNLPLPLNISARVLGRGTTDIVLLDEQARQIKISLNDGFIDNAVLICSQDVCPGGSQSNEEISVNLRRIVNVLAEAGVFACILWLALSLFRLLGGGSIKPPAHAVVLSATIVVILLHIVAVYLFSSGILGAIAHIPDAAIYVRQAILLGHGMYAAALPPAQPYEAFLSNSSLIESGSVVYRHASHFWPLFLAPFARLHLMTLVNPLLAFISISSLAYLVRVYWGASQAFIATLLFALSPFVFVNYGDFMMHGFCLTLVLLGVVCITRFERVRTKKWCILAGFFAGYCFGARQITAIAVGVPLLITWTLHLHTRKRLAELRFFLLGSIPCALGFLFNNYLVTGSPWRSIYTYVHGLTLSYTNLPVGLDMTDSMLGYLGSILLPSIMPSFALGLAFFGLIAQWSRGTLILASIFASLLIIHFFLNTNGLHGYGPRFLFEASAALIVLAALGTHVIIKRAPILGSVLVFAYVSLAILRLVNGLPAYRDYNRITLANYEQAKQLPAQSSILLVHGDSWQTFDNYAALFDPTWKGLLVVRALDDGSQQAIFDALPERRVHEIN